MRYVPKLLLVCLLLACCAGKAHGQAEIPHFASDPATCDPTRGMIYWNTTTSQLKSCTSLNTWSGSSAVSSQGIPLGSSISKSIFKHVTLPTQINIRSVMANSALPALASPATPSLATSTTGGTIPAGTYRIAITYVDVLGGETLISNDASSTQVTTGTTSTITTTSPGASAGAVGWRLYVSAASGAAGSEILYVPASAGCTAAALGSLSSCAIGANAVTTAIIVGTAGVPSTNTAHTVSLTQAHTISSPIQWPSITTPGTLFSSNGTGPVAEFFTLTRAGAPAVLGSTFNNNLYTVFTSVNYGGGTQTSDVGAWSFLYYGSAVEIFIKGTGGQFECKVNDQYMTLTPVAVPNDGNLYYFYIPFGSTALRRVEFIATNTPFGGAYTAATDTIQPAPVRGPRVIVVGDSFTEGTGAASFVNGYTQVMADALGWDDVWPSGVGSTGWLNNGTNPRVKFGSRLTTDVCPFSPDIVMFAGGINDWSLFTAPQIQAEVTADIQAVQSCVPGVTIIVLSPFWKGGASTFGLGLASNGIIGARDAIKAAAQNTGVFFLDVLEQPIPASVTPVTTTLAASASSGQAVISVNAIINIHSTIKFANGERYQVKSETNASAPFSITLDANLATTHNPGETVTQVGDPIWTGSGRQGATTGYGNSDLLVFTDGTHPSDAGHNVLGTVIAQALLQVLR